MSIDSERAAPLHHPILSFAALASVYTRRDFLNLLPVGAGGHRRPGATGTLGRVAASAATNRLPTCQPWHVVDSLHERPLARDVTPRHEPRRRCSTECPPIIPCILSQGAAPCTPPRWDTCWPARGRHKDPARGPAKPSTTNPAAYAVRRCRCSRSCVKLSVMLGCLVSIG